MSVDKDRQQDHALDFDRLLTRYNGRMAKAIGNMAADNYTPNPWNHIIAMEQLDYAFGCLDDFLVKQIGLKAFLEPNDAPGYRA